MLSPPGGSENKTTVESAQFPLFLKTSPYNLFFFSSFIFLLILKFVLRTSPKPYDKLFFQLKRVGRRIFYFSYIKVEKIEKNILLQ